MWQNKHSEDTRQAEKEIPPITLIGGGLKIKIAFCSKLAVLHATEVV